MSLGQLPLQSLIFYFLERCNTPKKADENFQEWLEKEVSETAAVSGQIFEREE